ncbi:amidohydrolase [Pontibacillus halophilus JSM 076056 = DSM 19796]|uniref:Amidohydrolase n=1 Tax=Pontibacillus halophilus JSM 076056 = DSM 19796 TaxID=1385510 RepID=A0A0A5I8U1_9BACI|nr:amidohydrolase [Pontibacillus halophilus]KGX92257.1 amidohydrolase [Pontibacillus halophilus JSM 076056 = DSM 19796]
MQTVYYGGSILTMEGEDMYVEALLVEGGVIRKRGSLDSINDVVDGPVEYVNLEGQTLMPSFIDPHSHAFYVGPVSQMADLSECESFENVVETLQAYIKENSLSTDDTVIGFGYDPTVMKEGLHPTKEVLDRVSSNPIFVMHASAHMGCANQAALDIAGIGASTEELEGGTIGRVEGSMEPNGYLEETNMMVMQQALTNGNNMGQIAMSTFEDGQHLYIRNGITTVQDGASTKDTIQLGKALASAGELEVDVVAYPLMDDNSRELVKENKEYVNQYHNRYKIGGYKTFLDGTPQGKTAWLSEPYEGEDSYCGIAWYKDEVVEGQALEAVKDGMQLLTHCNGDRAADQLLNSYEKAVVDTGVTEDLRPVMIHCQTTREDQLDRMAELSMIPSIFVDHTYYWGDVHVKNLGKERGERISPARTAFDKGLVVNFHQDAPVVKPNMLQTIWSAVNRVSRTGAIIGESERVTVYEALKAVTINAAYMYKEEGLKGTLEEGKLADLVILNQNPLKVNPMSIKDITVTQTIKEGKTLYKVGQGDR